MVHFQWKGKGILVLVYAFVPLFIFPIITKFVEESFFNAKFSKEIYLIVAGLSLVTSGFWTYFTSDDYYVDESGDKQYMDFDHKFMFLSMKIWAYIFWVIGASIIISGFADMF